MESMKPSAGENACCRRNVRFFLVYPNSSNARAHCRISHDARRPMPDRYRCRVEQASVRPERREALEGLIVKLFERRHHSLIASREKDWLTVELIQALREASQVYRDELSTPISGPLPFALGYFRVRGDALECTSDELPATVAPEPLVRLLSEFLQPGAHLWFGPPDEEAGWKVRGVNDIVQVSGAGEPQLGDASSAGDSS